MESIIDRFHLLTFELSLNLKSLNVDLDQELGFITSVVRCWVSTGKDYAQDQVQESLKRIVNWLEQVPDSHRPQISKAFLCLVKIVNSILICIKDGSQENILSALGGLFTNHMHFVLDMTRSFCDKSQIMDSQATLLPEKSVELPNSYKDLNEQMARVVARSVGSKIDINSDILDHVKFKLLLEPNLTISSFVVEKKWKNACLVLQEKTIKISTVQKSFFGLFSKKEPKRKDYVFLIYQSSILYYTAPNTLQLSLVNGSILFLQFSSKEIMELWRVKFLKAAAS